MFLIIVCTFKLLIIICSLILSNNSLCFDTSNNNLFLTLYNNSLHFDIFDSVSYLGKKMVRIVRSTTGNFGNKPPDLTLPSSLPACNP